MYVFLSSLVKWEGGAVADPRYHQVDGQLTISNVDQNRDKGAWTCSVITPGGELAKREVISKLCLYFAFSVFVLNSATRRKIFNFAPVQMKVAICPSRLFTV